jgi:hypothetical protein
VKCIILLTGVFCRVVYDETLATVLFESEFGAVAAQLRVKALKTYIFAVTNYYVSIYCYEMPVWGASDWVCEDEVGAPELLQFTMTITSKK